MAKEYIERYRKKPVVVEAIRFTRSNFHIVSEFTGGKADYLTIERCPNGRCYCLVETLEGNMVANEGDYIIKGVHGEFYPCKPDIFEKTHELESTAADVVEVVRCSECRAWCPCSSGKAGTCKGKVRGITKPEDFCSSGERRDNA